MKIKDDDLAKVRRPITSLFYIQMRAENDVCRLHHYGVIAQTVNFRIFDLQNASEGLDDLTENS